jgi:putative ABC transport system permease protein
MVGVAVVAVFTVFAASLKASVDETVSGSLTADLVVSGGGFGNGALSPDLARQIDELPSVRSAVGLGGGSVLVDGESTDVTVADPRTIPDVLDPEVVLGSLRALGPGEIAVSDTTSDDHHWRMGDSVPVTFTDGTTSDLTIGAIYGAEDFLSGYLIGRADWTPHAVQSTDSNVLVDLRSGASESAAIAAIERVADPFGAPDVETRAEYVDTVAGRIDTMLTLVYVMLALAVLIALMGIANTLSLSVYERTRELGLLRAVGETRGQLRSMVRWESVIIAVFGTIGGLALGLFLGWAFFEAASNDELGTFAAPVGQLVVILIVGGIAGVLAGIRPARRASRLAVLSAIAAA